MHNFITVVSGALFALGLIVGGMTNPDKVTGFLDLFGNWDPSLAFVMGGAVGLNVFTFRVILRRPNPLTQAEFRLPTKKEIDLKLIAGSALFGIGWGIAGFCPGPALVSAGTGLAKILFFVAMMIGGMWVHDNVLSKKY